MSFLEYVHAQVIKYYYTIEDLIYIAHGSGDSWIEMTANGKIDVYAKDSVSIHTENDFNFKAGRDIAILKQDETLQYKSRQPK